jgi:hypothetical protein
MMAQKETVAMRIVTVVTLIFLPATFVSVRPRNRCLLLMSPPNFCRLSSAPTSSSTRTRADRILQPAVQAIRPSQWLGGSK